MTLILSLSLAFYGKIMGNYMNTPEGGAAGDVFYRIAFGKEPYYRHQGWLSGRITTDDNFTFYEKPELDETSPTIPEADFVAKKTDMYYVSVDPSGRLGWKSSTLTYSDTKAHVLEVLTKKAGNAYKAFLRKLGISYIIAGTDTLNYALAMQKLKGLSGIETLFMAREELSDETPVRFDLQSAEVRNGGSVWLRYRVRPVKGA